MDRPRQSGSGAVSTTGLRCCCGALTLLLSPGIAVSAGELEEEQASALANTREELKQALLSLQATRAENKQLRVRLARYEGDEDGQARDEL